MKSHFSLVLRAPNQPAIFTEVIIVLLGTRISTRVCLSDVSPPFNPIKPQGTNVAENPNRSKNFQGQGRMGSRFVLPEFCDGRKLHNLEVM